MLVDTCDSDVFILISSCLDHETVKVFSSVESLLNGMSKWYIFVSRVKLRICFKE